MNEALQRLYQSVILEHHQHPRNRGPLEATTHEAECMSPLCGDRVVLHLHVDADAITAARFEGDGCAISLASASLLTTMVAQQRARDVRMLSAELRKLVDRDPTVSALADRVQLGDLVALEGVRQFPSRIGCATLAWDALIQALTEVH